MLTKGPVACVLTLAALGATTSAAEGKLRSCPQPKQDPRHQVIDQLRVDGQVNCRQAGGLAVDMEALFGDYALYPHDGETSVLAAGGKDQRQWGCRWHWIAYRSHTHIRIVSCRPNTKARTAFVRFRLS